MSIVNKVKSKPYKSSHVHMFNIRIPIDQNVLTIFTPEEVNDLADYIVKNHSKSFREAYQKTAAIINMAERERKKLDELTLYDLKKVEPNLTEDVLKVFDLKNSVNSKKSYGGTAFDNIKKMIIKYKKQL